MLIDLARIEPRGLIHAGCHDGKEAREYLNKFDPVVLIDPLDYPLPDECTQIRCCLSDADGTQIFHVASFDQSSSLKTMTGHKTAYPWVTEQGEQIVEVRTLDSLANDYPEIDDCNVLIMDIQGSEFEALIGAQQTLAHIDAVQVEVATRELYGGQMLIQDIDQWMSNRGYKRIAFDMHSDVEGDALYVR